MTYRYKVQTELEVEGEDRKIWVDVYQTDDLVAADLYAQKIETANRTVQVVDTMDEREIREKIDRMTWQQALIALKCVREDKSLEEAVEIALTYD